MTVFIGEILKKVNIAASWACAFPSPQCVDLILCKSLIFINFSSILKKWNPSEPLTNLHFPFINVAKA